MSLIGHNGGPPLLIWAFDIASQMGVAEGYAGEKPRLYTVRLASTDDDLDDAFGRAVKWMAERLLVERPDRIIIEAPIPGSKKNGKTSARSVWLTVGLASCITGTAKAKRVPVRRANISSVRKHFIGIGNLPGDVAKPRTVRLCRALGWEPPNHDAADAGACWHWGCAQFDREHVQSIERVRADVFNPASQFALEAAR